MDIEFETGLMEILERRILEADPQLWRALETTSMLQDAADGKTGGV